MAIAVIPAAIVAEKVRQALMDRAANCGTDFFGEDDLLYIDEESVFETAFDEVVGKLPDREYEKLYAEVLHHPIMNGAFDEMRIIAKEAAEDFREWQQAKQSPEAMLRYHGLTIHDFL